MLKRMRTRSRILAKMKFSTEEVWGMVEETRRREERLREPYLVAFSETREEIEVRKSEDAQEGLLDCDEFGRFAEGLARGGREEVRFQRYLIRQGLYPRISKGDPRGLEPVGG
jgi:hypothetical protein